MGHRTRLDAAARAAGPGTAITAAATLTATAADLLLVVWNRRTAAPVGAVTASGDDRVIDRFRRAPLR